MGQRLGGAGQLSELSGPGQSVVSVSTDAFRCDLLLSSTTRVARYAGGHEVVVVVHGELYPDPSGEAAQRCLRAYMAEGPRFVRYLHGSFALAIVDTSQDRVLFITDHANSRKLFFGEQDELAWVSTMHTLRLHPCSARPDPAGIAHSLVNGIPLNGRTPFDGVRVLDRASIHQIRGNEVTSETYWDYEPQPDPAATIGSTKGDLRDALLAAVTRRVPSLGEVRLSLSGGYDSTAILGALGLLGVPDVRCVSYRKPADTDRNDSSVARKMAEASGYSHTEIEAYRDDVGTVIGDNIRWGCGMTRLVVETDTWRTLRDLVPADDRTTFWVGDERFGMSRPLALHTDTDVLSSLGFADWSILGPLADLFSQTVSSLLADALREDLESMLNRHRAGRNAYVLRDYLSLDQKLQRFLSWREAFAEPCGEVRNPLLDWEILQLRQYHPQNLSVGKALFKDTVTEMFPDLFSIPRAVGGTWAAGQWCRQAVRTQSAALAAMIGEESSPLDSYIPPEGLLSMIGEVAGGGGAVGRLARKARTINGLVTKRRGGRRPTVDPAVFVLRALALRELFRQRVQPRSTDGNYLEPALLSI